MNTNTRTAVGACAGKVAVITGASKGLGAGLASAFAQAGLQLGLCARTTPAVPPGTSGLAMAVDVTDAGRVQQFCEAVVARFGRIDLWVNNAGILGDIKPLRDTSPEAVSRVLEINVGGVFNGSRSFARHLRARGGEGVLVNISSGAALHPYAGWSAYCASKAAVDRLTECLQLEEEAHGLRAYALAPGLVDTAMQAAIRATPQTDFPSVANFVRAKERGAFNSPAWVARYLLGLAFDPEARPAQVVLRVPPEHPA